MGRDRDISSQIYNIECDQFHMRNKNKMLKIFKRGDGIQSGVGGEIRKKVEPPRKVSRKNVAFEMSVKEAYVFKRSE